MHFILDILCYKNVQKNTSSAMHVLEQMEDVEVKPDAMTFACLISNSQSEKHITKVGFKLCEQNYKLYICGGHCGLGSLVNAHYG